VKAHPIWASVALGWLTLTWPEAALAGCEAGPGVQVARSGDVHVAFRTTPAAVKVGQPFGLVAEVCAPPGVAVSDLKVDALMPAHKHGMNYRTQVSRNSGNQFQVTGLLFHMPGRWQYVFEVQTSKGRQTLRLDDSVQ
jgi:hypothetical protein